MHAFLTVALLVIVALAGWVGPSPASAAPTLNAEVIIQGLGAPIPRQVVRARDAAEAEGGLALSDFGGVAAIGPQSFGGAGVTAEARAAAEPGLLTVFSQSRVDAFGNGRINTGARSEALASFTLHDVIFSGPGPSVPVVLRLRLDGLLGSSGASYGLTISTTFGRGTSTRSFFQRPNGSSDTPGGSSFLEGYLGGATILEIEGVVPTNVPVRLLVTLQAVVSAGFVSNGPGFAGVALGTVDLLPTLSFPADGPVFVVPEGVTVYSTSGRIVDNIWLGPERPTP